MSHDDKKRVALGTTLALVLGAGSYWVLGSGGGSDSDRLNSGPRRQKVIRVSSTDEPMSRTGNRRPKYAENGRKEGKELREPRATNPNARKTGRQRGSRGVIKKPKIRPPAA